MNVLNLIITVVTSIIAGLFASFIKPLFDYGIYKRTKRFDSRRQLMKDAIDFLSSDTFNIHKFQNSILYFQLLKYLSNETNDIINMSEEDYRICWEIDGPNIDIKHAAHILNDLYKIDEKWGVNC